MRDTLLSRSGECISRYDDDPHGPIGFELEPVQFLLYRFGLLLRAKQDRGGSRGRRSGREEG